MVKEEIVEGIRAALARGESLEKAMLSFYNAGYSREDIEAAASSVIHYSSFQTQQQTHPQQQAQQQMQSSQTQAPQPKPVENQMPVQAPQKPRVSVQSFPVQYQPQPKPLVQPQNQPVVQRVSNYGYGKKPSKKGTVVTVILFILLLLLLAILAGVILFKDELSAFFDTLLWIGLF